MNLKERLLRFYKQNCPSKCNDVDKIAFKYKNNEKELFRQLTFKYGPEPPMSNADKAIIRERVSKKKETKSKNDNNIDINEWLDSFLNNDDRELIKEIESYPGKSIPQRLLDKI